MIKKFKQSIQAIYSEQMLAYFIGFAYLVSILNFYHLLPSKRNLNLGLQVVFVISIGLFLTWAHHRFSLKKIGWSLFIWLSLFVLLLLQPILNDIIYPDSLIFSIGAICFICILSHTIYNIENKLLFTYILAWFLAIGGIVECFTQYAQLLQWTSLFDVFVYPISAGERPVGNIIQPNQAAFIYAMGISALLFIYDKKKLTIFTILSVFFLTSGIAISASRGGVILAIFSLFFYMLITERTFLNRLKYLSIFLSFASIGYLVGTTLLKDFSNMETAVQRIVNTSDKPLRIYQQEHAWLVIKDNLLTGVGWSNFPLTNIEYFEKISWIAGTDHTHFIVSQIASELGIIGLVLFIPFIFIILKNFKFSLNSHKTFILSILGIFTLYSCSEYPLWYFYYLIIFATFLSLIDIQFRIVAETNLKPIVMFITIVIFILSSYYYYHYMKYSKILYQNMFSHFSAEQKIQRVLSLKTPFGFTQYKEYILFDALPISNKHLTSKLDIGSRVSAFLPLPKIQQKQGLLFGLNGQTDLTLKYFKMACSFNFYEECNNVQKTLVVAEKSQPIYYSQTLKEFKAWRKDSLQKTNLIQD